MPKPLTALEAQVMVARAYALIKEFQKVIATSLEGDHPEAEAVENWLSRYEEATK
jgi:hypothetical protein